VRKRCDTRLRGWEGPYFPDPHTDQLIGVLSGCAYSILWLRVKCTRAAGFVAVTAVPPMTEDGYEWHCALTFRSGRLP
jgi:hypothetical protein